MITRKVKDFDPESIVKPELVADFRRGYKVIDKSQRCLFCFRFNWFKPYDIGENFSSRKTVERTEEEIKKNEVHSGFHIFLSLEDALRYCLSPEETIIEVYYKDTDVVAYGYTELDKKSNAATVVVTRLTIKSLRDHWYPYLKE